MGKIQKKFLGNLVASLSMLIGSPSYGRHYRGVYIKKYFATPCNSAITGEIYQEKAK